MTKAKIEQENRAKRLHDKVRVLEYNYNHPSFHRPIPRKVGMKDTLFGCYMNSPWLMWMFRNQAWSDQTSRRIVIKMLWEKRNEMRSIIDSMKPSLREEYINIMCDELYLRSEYKENEALRP